MPVLRGKAKRRPREQIISLYWQVSEPALRSVLDQVRTSLAEIVGELRAATPADQELPTPEAANQAVNIAVGGKRPRVTVTTAQSSGAGSTSTAGNSGEPKETGFWTRGRRIGALVVGVATIVAAVFGGFEVFGTPWN